jgi:tryptophanyl-tRNA synthetase
LFAAGKLFTGEQRPEIEARFAGKGYAALKRELAEVIIAGLRPLQMRYQGFATDPASLDAFLTAGAAKVRPLAEKTLAIARDRVGL